MSELQKSAPELAYYYGATVWQKELTDWVKSLLLFFDGIAICLSRDEAERFINSDPVLAQPLVERGLLTVYPPSSLFQGMQLDESSKDPVATALLALFDEMDRNGISRIPEFMAEDGERAALLKTPLEAMGFIFNQASAAQVDFKESIQILAAAQIGQHMTEVIKSAAIRPVINNDSAALFIRSVLTNFPGTSESALIMSDMNALSVDLSVVPLDEILGFRSEHDADFRAYVQDVRRFTLSSALIPENERVQFLRDRSVELTERSQELFSSTQKAFKRSVVTLMFGLTGAAWTLAHGDPTAAVLAAGGAAAGTKLLDSAPTRSAYSYILRTKMDLSQGRNAR